MTTDGTPLGLWRLTRNDLGRSLYEALADRGVTFALMRWYEAEALDGPTDRSTDGVRLAPLEATGASGPDRLEPYREAGDVVVCAVADGHLVGHCLLSDRPVEVPEFETTLALDGAYLWRLFVEPSHRGRGVGTAVIRHARTVAAAAFGADAVSALVARDNRPSRRAFETAGFDAGEAAHSLGVGGTALARSTGRS